MTSDARALAWREVAANAAQIGLGESGTGTRVACIGWPPARGLAPRLSGARRAQLASTPGRIEPCHGGAAQKRLQVVPDEKSPTDAPPTFTRVTPAELSSAVGDE